MRQTLLATGKDQHKLGLRACWSYLIVYLSTFGDHLMQNTNQTFLIVDDARDIREPLAVYLRKHGFEANLAADASEARKTIAGGGIDLIVLDIMMPGEDGLSLCRWVHENTEIPVILLTAMVTDVDRIVGLELGADDYMSKPFNPRELVARARAIWRRMPQAVAQNAQLPRRFGPWTHDPECQSVLHDNGHRVPLSSGENKLLICFLDRPRTTLSRTMLLAQTVGRQEKAYDRAIDNHISRLRRKIEPNTDTPTLIVTDWGGGYQLKADVIDVVPAS